MANTPFIDLAKRKFEYLVEEYKFSVVDEYENWELSDGRVEYQSSETVVLIQLDKGNVTTLIGPRSEPEIIRLSLNTVVSYLLHMGNVDLNNHPGQFDDIRQRVEYCLNRDAMNLRKFCEPILLGDFSWWVDAVKYYLKQAQEEYRKLTGEDLPIDKRYLQYINANETH